MLYGDNDYSSINYSIQIRLNNYRSNEDEIVEESCMRTKKGRIVENFFRIYEVDMVLGEKLWYTSREERIARWCRLARVTTMKKLKGVISDGFMGKELDDQLIEEVNRYSTDSRVIALYTKLSREELERNTLFKEAKEEAEQVTKEAKEEAEKIVKKAKEQAYEYGYHSEIEKYKYDIVKKLLEENSSIEFIMKVTDLSKSKIEEIKELFIKSK